jgi:predicted DNA-binding protein (MmcQ/YjbR family)
MFAQSFFLKGEPKVTLNCTPEAAEFLRSLYPGTIVRGWHFPPVMQPHFNTIALNGVLADEEFYRLADHSYAVVTGKLPKYIQRELTEETQ